MTQNRAQRPVTVLTTVLNERDAIDGLLGVLRQQARPGDQILVVDGGSTDGTREAVLDAAVADHRVTLLDAPGSNIPRGRNLGIARARHDVVCCTDAGCVPVDGWLEALRAPFDGPYPPDLVTGIYRVAGDTPVQRALAVAGYPHPDDARHTPALVKLWGRLFGRLWDPTMPTGRSVAFTVAAWRAVGGFPEHLDAGEDVSFGRLVAGQGVAVLAPDAEVAWEQRPTLRATARMYRGYGVGGGRGDDAVVIGRDLVRVAALAMVPWLLRPGRRLAALVAGLVYVSVPTARALRDDGPLVALLVTPAVALKDVAKAVGVAQGLATRGDRRR